MGLTNASRISQCINEIGEAKISIDENTGLFLLNSNQIEDVTVEFYNDLFLNFRILLYTQLREKCDIILLNKYCKEAKFNLENISKIEDEYKFKYFNAIDENEEIKALCINKIRKRLFTLFTVLKEIILLLEEEIEYFDYRISTDYQLVLNSLEQHAKFSSNFHAGKATFKMSKKETLMLLFLLEQNKLLKFDNDIQRKKFIENNFNYTEMRENKDNYEEPCELNGIGKDFSNFTSNVDSDIISNNKTLETLLKKLKDSIHEYEFKIKKY